MTDQHILPPAVPAAPAAPAAAVVASAAEPGRTLSIVALALGIVGIVLGGTFGAAPIAAVVLGHVALRREPDGRPLAITGLVLGYLGIGFVVLIGLFAALAMLLPFAFLPFVASVA